MTPRNAARRPARPPRNAMRPAIASQSIDRLALLLSCLRDRSASRRWRRVSRSNRRRSKSSRKVSGRNTTLQTTSQRHLAAKPGSAAEPVHPAAPARGRRADLSGGGLRRSAGAWTAVEKLSRGRECFTHDERVLGRPRFVASLLRAQVNPPRHNADQSISLEDVIGLVCRAAGISRANLLHSARTRARSRAREGIAYLWICYLGRSGHELAARLGIAPVSAYRCAKRGEREGPEWCRLLQVRR